MPANCNLYLPFEFSQGVEIKDLPFNTTLDGYDAELEKNGEKYAVLLRNVPSEEAANAEMSRLMAALTWAAVEMKKGILWTDAIQTPNFPDDPVAAAKQLFGESTDRKVDVIIDGGQAAIWPDGKERATLSTFPVGVLNSYSPSQFSTILSDALTLKNLVAALSNSKLSLAVDLYCLSHFRSSNFARFLVLWMVLETAAPTPEVGEASKKLIKHWQAQARAQSEEAGGDNAAAKDLSALAQRLGNFKQQSHRGRITDYVEAMLERVGDPRAKELAQAAKALYDVRGKLTHDGHYKLGDRLRELDEIVCATLKAAMRTA